MNEYQEILLDHSKNPRNFIKSIDDSFIKIDGQFPNCAEKITIGIKIQNNILTEITWTGDGGMFFKASASILTDFIKNKEINYLKEYINYVYDCFTGKNKDMSKLNKMIGLTTMMGHPRKLKSVLLPIHAIKQLLESKI